MKKWQYTMLIVLAALVSPVLAEQCETEIESNDAVQFNKSSISIPKSCEQFTLKLKHTGKLPKTGMGHNWVLTKAADAQGVATDGMSAGLDKEYVKPDDARVIAHTKIIGGGESDSVTFAVDKLSAQESYSYFCSFPGHSAIMKGTLQLAD
jgi:azurin